MSHPEGISVLLRRRISRIRRRMRFRTTAPPNAFLTLMPNRLTHFAASACCERKKTANWGLERRWPAPYTASYSTRFNRRTARGKSCRGPSESLDARKTMASLLAARREYFAASCGLHACAKAVRLVTPAHFWLKRAFRQRVLPSAPPRGPSQNM